MRLVLCDDHDMFLRALKIALSRRGCQVEAVSQELHRVVDLVVEHRPEVCVLDVMFGDTPALDAAGLIRERAPDVKVLLLTGATGADVWQAYDAHVVDGVVDKACDIEVLQACIVRVARGERVVAGCSRPAVRRTVQAEEDVALTARERQVLALLVNGASTRMIATELGVSGNTVRTHVQNLLLKLDVADRGKAVHAALARGLAGPGVAAT